MKLENKKNLLESDPILVEMVKRLVEEFHPEKIYLFGSRAKGTAHADSDYAFLIVLSEKNEHTHALSIRAGEILADIETSTDLIFTSLEKFEKRKNVIGALAEIAHSEGKELAA